MEDNPKPPLKSIELSSLPIKGIDELRPIYTNYAAVNMTNWDIRVMFAEIVPIAKSAEIQAREVLVMTPAHAKALASMLAENIKKFEQVNGEIPWPPKAAGREEAATKSRTPRSH